MTNEGCLLICINVDWFQDVLVQRDDAATEQVSSNPRLVFHVLLVLMHLLSCHKIHSRAINHTIPFRF